VNKKNLQPTIPAYPNEESDWLGVVLDSVTRSEKREKAHEDDPSLEWTDVERYGSHVLHWLPDEDRWEPIAWADWKSRGFGIWVPDLCYRPDVPAGSVADHYVVVIDDPPVNIMAHKYMIGPDGKVYAPDYGLTDAEREDYERLGLVLPEWNAAEKARIDEIREKAYPAIVPPRASIPALRRALESPTPGSRAEEFFRRLLPNSSPAASGARMAGHPARAAPAVVERSPLPLEATAEWMRIRAPITLLGPGEHWRPRKAEARTA
jgi:hypothetical protein